MKALLRKALQTGAGITIVLLLAGCAPKTQETKLNITDTPVIQKINSDLAFKTALNVYAAKKAEGIDMTKGPCLGLVANDWVLDIAHNPRQSVDDKPENQCEDYRTGKVHHFIELDEDGKLITSH